MIAPVDPAVVFAKQTVPGLFLADADRFVGLLGQHGDQLLQSLWDSAEEKVPEDNRTGAAGLGHRLAESGDTRWILVSVPAGRAQLSSPASTANIPFLLLVSTKGKSSRCFALQVPSTGHAAASTRIIEVTKGGGERDLGVGPPPDGAAFLQHMRDVLNKASAGAPKPAAKQQDKPRPRRVTAAEAALAAESEVTMPASKPTTRTPITPYVPSGRIGAVFFPVALASGVVVVLAAALYQVLVHYIPIIYFNVLLTAGLAFVVGLSTALAVNFGKCRSHSATLLLGFVLSLVALGAAFAVDFKFSGEEMLEVAEKSLPFREYKQLEDNWDFIAFLDAKATRGWEIGRRMRGGTEISGWGVYLVWLLEMLIVLGGTMFFLSAMAPAKDPFCEDCCAWLPKEEDEDNKDHSFGQRVVEDSLIAVSRVKRAQIVEELLAVASEPKGKKEGFGSCLVFSLTKCRKHPDNTYGTVERFETKRDEKGNDQTESKTLLPWSHVPSDLWADLLRGK